MGLEMYSSSMASQIERKQRSIYGEFLTGLLDENQRLLQKEDNIAYKQFIQSLFLRMTSLPFNIATLLLVFYIILISFQTFISTDISVPQVMVRLCPDRYTYQEMKVSNVSYPVPQDSTIYFNPGIRSKFRIQTLVSAECQLLLHCCKISKTLKSASISRFSDDAFHPRSL